MADNKKISELTELQSGDVANTDEIEVRSGSSNLRFTWASLKTALESALNFLTPSSTDTLTNKTIIDATNTVEADSIHLSVRNDSGATLTKSTPVYISGYNVGQDIVLVDAADADDITKMPAIGIIQTDIDNNENGIVIVQGRLEDIDTSSFSVGDWLYVSTTGTLTSTKPVTGDVQPIGQVVRSNATTGLIDVAGPLTTVTVTSPAVAKGDLEVHNGTRIVKLSVGTNDLPLVADSTDPEGITYKVLPVAGGGTGASDAATARSNLGAGTLDNIVEDTTPQLGGDLDAQSTHQIINLIDPTADQEAATKKYVDDNAGGGGGSTVSIVPTPAIGRAVDGSQTISGNTTAYYTAFNLPVPITVNKISIRTSNTHTTGSTFDIAIFSADGQTKEIGDETTPESTTTDETLTVTLGAGVELSAGLHYFVVIANNASVNLNVAAWQQQAIWIDDVSGEHILMGTSTETAGTLPTTFNPATEITASSSSTTQGFVFRLDN